VVINRGED